MGGGRGRGLLGPPSLQLHADRIRVGEGWQRTLALAGYPREVGYGWLARLLAPLPDVNVSLHVEPFPAELAAQRLHKQRARFESTRRLEAEHGRLANLGVAAAAEDAHQLASRLARGESRLFRAGLYLTITANSEPGLDHATARVRSLCASQLLTCTPATFRALEGWQTGLPLSRDQLRLRRTFDSQALAASFPFAASEPPFTEDGCFYGLSDTGAPVIYDRFAQDNYNSVILARTGAGKSYLAKLEALRLLYQGVQVFIVDPDDEYKTLCHAVGGAHIPLGGPNPATLNPLDLPTTDPDPAAIAERTVFLTELVELMAGGLTGAELAALDQAAHTTYTSHPGAGAPLLADLANQLQHGAAAGKRLAERLAPYTTGSLSQLFSGQTSVQPEGQLVCFSLRGLSERLKPVALALCLDVIWRQLDHGLRKRCVLVDEAWLLMREPAGAGFLYRLAKSARKRWCGLTTITQDAGDLLASELGQAIIANASNHILLRQAPQAIDRIQQAFRLTDGEAHYLLACPQGHGLFILADNRFPLQITASPTEHRWATTNPAHLAAEETA